jgi:hypothetical protein
MIAMVFKAMDKGKQICNVKLQLAFSLLLPVDKVRSKAKILLSRDLVWFFFGVTKH